MPPRSRRVSSRSAGRQAAMRDQHIGSGPARVEQRVLAVRADRHLVQVHRVGDAQDAERERQKRQVEPAARPVITITAITNASIVRSPSG